MTYWARVQSSQGIYLGDVLRTNGVSLGFYTTHLGENELKRLSGEDFVIINDFEMGNCSSIPVSVLREMKFHIFDSEETKVLSN